MNSIESSDCVGKYIHVCNLPMCVLNIYMNNFKVKI